MLIIVGIGQVENASIKKRSLNNYQTELQLRNVLRDILDNDEKESNKMFQRRFNSYGDNYMKKKSEMDWDLTDDEKACVYECASVPDDEFEDCYDECNADE